MNTGSVVACTLVPSPEHSYPDHPENPARFTHFSRLLNTHFPKEIEWLAAEPALPGEAAWVHLPEMLSFLQSAVQQAPVIIESAPTYVSPGSWTAALNAAGGVLTCLRAVLRGQASAGFALVRPPGHHAEPERSMGFCLLNNLAIAARAALEEGVERVLIVDYDAHHGNGTQQAFLNEARVAFVSTHQAGIYPPEYGSLGDAPQARGRIVNVPLPAQAGEQCFQLIMEQVIRPLALRFQPGLVLVSAGFDAHWSDPLTGLGMTTQGYFRLSQALVNLAGKLCAGKIVFALEGGYDPRALADNVLAALCALAGGESISDPAGPSPQREPDITLLIERVRALHGLG